MLVARLLIASLAASFDQVDGQVILTYQRGAKLPGGKKTLQKKETTRGLVIVVDACKEQIDSDATVTLIGDSSTRGEAEGFFVAPRKLLGVAQFKRQKKFGEDFRKPLRGSLTFFTKNADTAGLGAAVVMYGVEDALSYRGSDTPSKAKFADIECQTLESSGFHENLGATPFFRIFKAVKNTGGRLYGKDFVVPIALLPRDTDESNRRLSEGSLPNPAPFLYTVLLVKPSENPSSTRGLYVARADMDLIERDALQGGGPKTEIPARKTFTPTNFKVKGIERHSMAWGGLIDTNLLNEGEVALFRSDGTRIQYTEVEDKTTCFGHSRKIRPPPFLAVSFDQEFQLKSNPHNAGLRLRARDGRLVDPLVYFLGGVGQLRGAETQQRQRESRVRSEPLLPPTGGFGPARRIEYDSTSDLRPVGAAGRSGSQRSMLRSTENLSGAGACGGGDGQDGLRPRASTGSLTGPVRGVPFAPSGRHRGGYKDEESRPLLSDAAAVMED